MIKVMAPAGAVFLGLLAVTNPHPDAHSRAVVSHAERQCDQQGEVGRLVCGGMAAMASLGLSYEDHMLYSTAHLGRVTTIGALGQVMVVEE